MCISRSNLSSVDWIKYLNYIISITLLYGKGKVRLLFSIKVTVHLRRLCLSGALLNNEAMEIELVFDLNG